MRRLRLNGPLLLGLLLLAGLVILLVLPSVISLKHPQMAQIVAEVDGRVRTAPFSPGEAGFVLGSDLLGRDYLSRLIHGARVTLAIVLAINLTRALISIPLGLLAGWHGGWLGRLVQSSSNGMGSIPTLILVSLTLIALRGLILDPVHWIVVFCGVVVVAGIPRMAEQIRLRTQEVSLMPYIEAAVAVGASPPRLIRRHIVPVISADLLVMLASETAWVLLMMGQLAVFGIYVGGFAALPGLTGEPTRISEYWPEWGQMFGRTRHAILQRAWLPLLPGMALALTAACFQLLAEGLRLRWVRR